MKSRNTTKRFTDGAGSGGYLHGVLLDGAKPFLYRSGVRTLLGVPDAGGSLHYAPPVPPAGFQYVQRSRFDGRTPDTPGGDHEVVREYPHRIARSAEVESIEDRSDVSQSATPPHAVAPVAAEVPMPASIAMPHRAQEAKSSTDLPPAPAREASEGRSATNMEIPGISRAIRDFPALRATVSPEELQPGGEPAGKKKESNPSQDQATPSADAPVADIPPAVHAPTLRMMAPRREPPAQEPKGNPRRGSEVEEHGEREGTIVRSAEVLKSATQSPEGLIPALRREPSMPVRAISRPDPAAGSELYPDPIAPATGALALRGTLEHARGKERLEGVERIVERVMARREAAREGTDEESQRPREPQQQVQVVVAPRPAAPAKIPCAFWERSYLHRFRIRTLR